jgi:cell division protein FtsQ
MALVACLVSFLAFFAATDFGRHVRRAPPLIDQLDRLLVTSGWGISEVWLTGHRFAIDSELFAALGLDDAKSLVGFDPRRARERIERLSWVDTAVVSRVFPDGVRVEIKERRPIAVWIDGNRQALIDASGGVLAYVTPGAAGELPKVSGADAPLATTSLLAALERHPDVARRIEIAERVASRRWTLALSGGGKVLLGTGALDQDLSRLEDVLRPQQMLDRGTVIDLRLADRVTLRGVAYGADGVASAQPSSTRNGG